MTEKPVHILYVEGDAEERARVEKYVREHVLHFEIDAVESAREALDLARSRKYDLALIDYRFSDGTVFDLLQQLGSTPAVFLTRSGQEEVAALVMERGAYDFLMKDDDLNYLVLLPATVRKVLARKCAEDASRESEARCRDLLETLLDLYLCVDEGGSILLANRAGASQLGYTVSEMLGQSVFSVAHPAEAEKLKQLFLLAAAHPDRVYRFNIRMVRKDGGLLELEADMRGQPAMGRQVAVVRILAHDRAREEPKPAPPAAVAPAAALAATPPVEVTVVPGPAPVPDELKGTERVLIVDDVPEQRAVTARMLTRLGYQVVTAESGRAAVELMREGGADGPDGAGRSPFDVVLLDMAMEEGFDGLDTYREMLSLYADQRCIIVSGGGEDERVREMRTLGAGQFVGKPFTFRQLGQAVRKELGRSR